MNRSIRWGTHVLLSVVLVGCTGAAETAPSPSQAQPVGEAAEWQEACRAGRAWFDAHKKASATSEGGEDPTLRAASNQARAEFARRADRLENAFSAAVAGWDLALVRFSAIHESPAYQDSESLQAEAQEMWERITTLSDQVHATCLERTGVDIRRE